MGVLSDVLEMFDHLQPVAHVVGQDHALWGGGTEDHEHESSDRRGRQAAVPEEILESLVRADPLVHPVGLDQIHKGIERKAEIDQRRAELLQEGVSGSTLGGQAQFGLQPVELRQPVAFGLVPDVVSQPCEAVDGQQVGALRTREEQGGDRKVLTPGLGHHRSRFDGRSHIRRSCARCQTATDPSYSSDDPWFTIDIRAGAPASTTWWPVRRSCPVDGPESPVGSRWTIRAPRPSVGRDPGGRLRGPVGPRRAPTVPGPVGGGRSERRGRP